MGSFDPTASKRDIARSKLIKRLNMKQVKQREATKTMMDSKQRATASASVLTSM